MPRTRDEAARAETAAEIKKHARQQLADKGTNGISLRGIARAMDMTAPAIYNYFPRLDDLITALLVDAFNGHADAMQTVVDNAETPVEQMIAALHAYREWALDHVADFQLIYGNPIPGYEAPMEITVPLASRPQEMLTRCLLTAYAHQPDALPARYQNPPESIVAHVESWLYDRFPEIQTFPHHIAVFYLMQTIWSRVHGVVMLEIHGHITPSVGDVDTFYANVIHDFLHDIGLSNDMHSLP
ncbi:MAG: TetR/AcrR family transcriptional regulator [Chloroflexota bacterium]